MTALRSTGVLALAAVAACSSDGPTPPRSDRLANQLNALADSSESFGPFGFALYSAAAIVEAGGSISDVTIELDGVPEQFEAVAFRMSYSDEACDQMISGLDSLRFGLDNSFVGDTVVVVDTGGGIVEGEWDFLCAPRQSLVAWQGNPVRRIAVIQGDTGTNTISNEEWTPWTFWASYFDRDQRADWWLDSGTQQASLIRDNGPCQQAPRPGMSDQVECRIATLLHSFDLDMYGFIWDDEAFPVLPVRARSAIIADTVVYGDTGIVIFPEDSTWTPPESHTMRMTPRTLSGVSMRVLSVDMTWVNRRIARAMLARPRGEAR